MMEMKEILKMKQETIKKVYTKEVLEAFKNTHLKPETIVKMRFWGLW